MSHSGWPPHCHGERRANIANGQCCGRLAVLRPPASCTPRTTNSAPQHLHKNQLPPNFNIYALPPTIDLKLISWLRRGLVPPDFKFRIKRSLLSFHNLARISALNRFRRPQDVFLDTLSPDQPTNTNFRRLRTRHTASRVQ